DIEGVVSVLFMQFGGVLQEREDAKRHRRSRGRRRRRWVLRRWSQRWGRQRPQQRRHRAESFHARQLLKNRRRAGSEVTIEYRHRIDSKPLVEQFRVNRSEVGLEADIARVVLQRGIARSQGRRSAV